MSIKTQDLKHTIRHLEQASQSLEPNSQKRQEYRARVMGYTEEFLQTVQQQPGYRETRDMGAELELYPIVDAPGDIDTALRLFADNVDKPGSHPTSPTHLAYIPVSATYLSALGDYLAAVSNRFSGNFFAGPGAVRLENVVLRWMMDLVGFGDCSAGNLTSGGSIANLSAIVTAREARGLSANDYARAVVYQTVHAHHCIQKALTVAGLKECIQRFVRVDRNGCMCPEDLQATIMQDKREGLRPWLLVATAGSTNLGSIDPLIPLGDIAEAHELWFHVDGAYGGVFLLTDLVHDQFQGLERADSVVLDPHKGLYVPFGTGAVLVREGAKLYDAHAHTADYLQDTEDLHRFDNPSDLGPELSRHFRAVRLWLPLTVLGLSPFKAALAEKVLLARYAYGCISEIDRFEVGPYPQLSIFVFRYVPESGDPYDFNRRLLERVRQDGRVFLSSTVVDDKFMIRFPVLSFRTHLESIDLAIDILQEYVAELS